MMGDRHFFWPQFELAKNSAPPLDTQKNPSFLFAHLPKILAPLYIKMTPRRCKKKSTLFHSDPFKPCAPQKIMPLTNRHPTY